MILPVWIFPLFVWLELKKIGTNTRPMKRPRRKSQSETVSFPCLTWLLNWGFSISYCFLLFRVLFWDILDGVPWLKIVGSEIVFPIAWKLWFETFIFFSFPLAPPSLPSLQKTKVCKTDDESNGELLLLFSVSSITNYQSGKWGTLVLECVRIISTSFALPWRSSPHSLLLKWFLCEQDLLHSLLNSYDG